MGVGLILLGLLAAGLVVDLVIENDLAGGPTGVSLLGGTFTFSESQLVVGAALLGALSVLLVVLGIGFVRGSWGRRRALKSRVAELAAENAALRSRAHLAAIVRSPPGEPPQDEHEVIVLDEADEHREGADAGQPS